MGEPKTRPILFSGEMVRTILDGRKTQTRRVIRFNHDSDEHSVRDDVTPIGNKWLFACDGDEAREDNTFSCVVACPYGQPGDLLVPRTTWAIEKQWNNYRPLELPIETNWPSQPDMCQPFWSHWDGCDKPNWCGKSRPGRFLPKRLWHLLPRLEVRVVRVERVQDIGKDGRKAHDVFAEGISQAAINQESEWFHPDDAPAVAFSRLWDSINAKRGYPWADEDLRENMRTGHGRVLYGNPWVWVVTFRHTNGAKP